MTTTRLAPRFRTTVGTLLAASLLLAGCGGKDSAGEAAPATPDSPASSGSADAPAPATGPVVETKWFTAHVPKGWKVHVEAPDFSITSQHGLSGESIHFGIVGTYGYPYSLHKLARMELQAGSWDPQPRIVEDTEVAGQPAFHLHGDVGDGMTLDGFGVSYREQSIDVIFTLEGSATERQAIIDSVLASIELK